MAFSQNYEDRRYGQVIIVRSTEDMVWGTYRNVSPKNSHFLEACNKAATASAFKKRQAWQEKFLVADMLFLYYGKNLFPLLALNPKRLNIITSHSHF
ncbi:hypothetical protein CEXT_734591 [Caerostris extrusa]|uniref:Uncharacterized protein n=1 Tax=Caerostris extrusa TaxID=172846 RepID=A0AAV4V0U0_CAEEX|nr:hypothetical protein CEXT_734591 [Caerostris extrusa]